MNQEKIMKSLIVSTLSAIALSSLVAPAFANEVARQSASTASINQITPFNLITGAYQGRFKNQGIPSNAIFLTKVRGDQITAKTLVEAAIANRRLEPEAISDKAYLRSVDSLLEDFDRL